MGKLIARFVVVVVAVMVLCAACGIKAPPRPPDTNAGAWLRAIPSSK